MEIGPKADEMIKKASYNTEVSVESQFRTSLYKLSCELSNGTYVD